MRRTTLLVLLSIVIVGLLDEQATVSCESKSVYNAKQHVAKQRRPPKKSLSKLPTRSQGMSANELAASLVQFDDLMVPIKKLTRKKMIRLLIKSIKRVNKNAQKQLNKSDNKSIEFRPTQKPFTAMTSEQTATRRGLHKDPQQQQSSNSPHSSSDMLIQYKLLVNDLALSPSAPNSHHHHHTSTGGRARSGSNDRINFEIKDKRPLISRTNSLIGRPPKESDQLKLASQYSPTVVAVGRSPAEMLYSSHARESTQVPVLAHLFNRDLSMNGQLDQATLNAALLHLHDHLLNQQVPSIHSNHLDYTSGDHRSYHQPIGGPVSDEEQIIRIHLPIDEITESKYPVYVHDQLNSTNVQRLIRQFVRSQLDQTNARSDLFSRKGTASRLLSFIGKQLDIDTDRNDETALQAGVTKVLGAFVGDIVGVVIEEILHKRGDKLVDGVRTRIGDFATLLINKSNLTLEMAVKSLSRLLVKKRFH